MRTQVMSMMLFCAAVSGCGDSAEQRDREAVAEQQEQYTVSQPIPKFDWSLERDVAIQLYQARNENVRTWTVWRSDYGMIEGYCESVGYPIPYDVQLTNPLKAVGYSRSKTTIEQAEPNGLYSSHNSIATWVRSIVRVNGKVVEAPIYVEGKVTCYPYPVVVDYEANTVRPADGAQPTVTIEDRRQ